MDVNKKDEEMRNLGYIPLNSTVVDSDWEGRSKSCSIGRRALMCEKDFLGVAIVLYIEFHKVVEHFGL
jgi:hypothetical protein